MTSRRIPAVWMRGGARKAVFFHGRDLPFEHAARDALLMRLMGGPDPSGLYPDGLGGGAGRAGLVVVSPSRQDDCDVDAQIGELAPDAAHIEWSRPCDHLPAAVGAFALAEGLVPLADGLARVRIRNVGTGQRVDACVPVGGGEVLERGVFTEDGVPFASSEVRLEFLTPGDDNLLPTGMPQDLLEAPGAAPVAATLIAAGRPMVFLRADALGLDGREPADRLGRNRRLLERLEALRTVAAVRMGLAETVAEAARRQVSAPWIAWVARPALRRAHAGEAGAAHVDLVLRVLASGRLQNVLDADAAIAAAAAAALPGTVVAAVARTLPSVPTRIGHAAGTLAIGADLSLRDGRWRLDRAVLSRGARRLMSGWVHAPSAGLSRPA